MTVYVNDEELSQAVIDDWELKRSRVVARFLKSEFGVAPPLCDVETDGDRNIASIRVALMQAKLALDPLQVRRTLRVRLALSWILIKVLNFLSLGKRKVAVVEIVCEGASANDIVERIGDLFLVNSPRNRELTLLGSPDHYVLEARDGRVQEIVETPGGSPMQSQLFVGYGDQPEVDYPRDPGYPFQMAGVARLRGGTAVGAIRHQYRDEGNGFRAKIVDEFPALFPRCMVRAQELHLACEFGIWYRALIEQPAASSEARDPDESA